MMCVRAVRVFVKKKIARIDRQVSNQKKRGSEVAGKYFWSTSIPIHLKTQNHGIVSSSLGGSNRFRLGPF